MSGQLKNSSISAPGFLGLNSQESEVTLESGYATEANNCIIDRYGRLGSRRGYTVLTTDLDTLLATDEIRTIFEFKDNTGTITYLSAGGGKLFTGVDTLVERTLRNSTDTADITLVSVTDRWQGAALINGIGYTASTDAFFAQRGSPLLLWHEPSAGYIWQRAGDIGAVPTGTTVDSFDPDCVLAAFGRTWCASLSQDRHTVFYSVLADGADFAAAGSGILDISSVVGNNDEIVAIADHNKYLIIFCKNNIVVYANADDPTNITLADVVTGVGCIARDSVQKTGTDLIFLSKSGVRSLNRTLQENSMPMRELSINVRDELVDDINNETLANIKSVYFERDAFYLLSFPSTGTIYCFDTRNTLENGGARTTKWTGLEYTAFCPTEDRKLYFGIAGGIAEYRGYLDGANTYRMTYSAANTNFGAAGLLKFPKKFEAIVIGNETQDFVVKYAFDYSTNFTSRTFSSNEQTVPSEYNIAEYGIGEYTGGLQIAFPRVHLGGSGKIVKFGLETVINNAPVSFQKIDVFIKIGKLI